ncbi:class I SAM-dependent methyltransferase [Simiduia curdlanivorans]|uniref:Class I SAM-dependent methyltransferase n=1 Tax=Simiduia curdlanivorans TaxID=1492769 RepID=A0ABV8V683_9GAMM|nr:class I SAM-dependent methyltransferase [Simiduia curdlanivorans]MDN3637426.1 class I SAM-dependent methyltransferase [Simiduia curdlanivorans]
MLTVDFKHFPLKDGDRLLDLGCGEGRHAINAYIAGNIDVFAVDLNPSDLAIAQQRQQPFAEKSNAKSFHLQCADALKLPFPDHCFDKIICSEVLEHLPDYQGALTEIQRILKPGGTLAISVPRAWPEKICWKLSSAYHQVEGGHLRIFNSQTLNREIEQFGFKRYQRHWAHALHSPFWWLKCALWNQQEQSRLIRGYHKLLVWDLMQKPWLTQTLEKLLNPIMGKSVVMYYHTEDTV